MRRACLVVLTVALGVAGALAVAGSAIAGPATSIRGTWIGHLTPPGGHAGQRFMVVVDRGERAGTWRIGSRCAGTLRLKDISAGYHHYYRVPGANSGCAPAGIDCLKRDGAQMVDEFVPSSGGVDSTIRFRRIA